MDPVSERLKQHYEGAFASHGATARGVDWGREEDVLLRYAKMLAVLDGFDGGRRPSLLDVGCGYGGLLDYATASGRSLRYTGIDLCEPMVLEGRRRHPEARFEVVDVLDFGESRDFDVVVCNGILTQKLDTSIAEMNRFAGRLIPRLFALCRHAAAFNVMTTRVNFMAPNLYYRSPVEMLAYCIDQITPRVRIDHAYPLFEYTVYLHRDADGPGPA